MLKVQITLYFLLYKYGCAWMASNKLKKEMDEEKGSNKRLLLMSSEQNDNQPSTSTAGTGSGDTQVDIVNTGR